VSGAAQQLDSSTFFFPTGAVFQEIDSVHGYGTTDQGFYAQFTAASVGAGMFGSNGFYCI
jgi:hypothetical protein